MDISEKWTPTERMLVIAEISKKIERLIRRDRNDPTTVEKIFHLNNTIYYLSFMGARFLESNRNQILDDARDERSAS